MYHHFLPLLKALVTGFYEHSIVLRGIPGGLVVKNPPAMQETWV